MTSIDLVENGESGEELVRLFRAVDWEEVSSCIFATEQEYSTSSESTDFFYALMDDLDAFLNAFRETM